MRLYGGLAVAIVATACGWQPVMRPMSVGEENAYEEAEGEAPFAENEKRCGPHSARALMACVEAGRLERDLRRVARPRPVSSAHHHAARRLCAERFIGAGYEVELHDYGSGINVVGKRAGFTKGAEQVLVSAHYDHLPGCSGADDNASGLAALLEIARLLAEVRFDRTLVVACWDEGEHQQAGSRAYARRARAQDQRIVAAIVLEAIAYADSAKDTQRVPAEFERLFPDQSLSMLENDYRADFVTVVADRHSAALGSILAGYANSLALPAYVLPLTEFQTFRMGELHRSDQLSFWQQKYPAILLTDTGAYRNPFFHCKKADDLPHTLNYAFLTAVTRTTLASVFEVLEPR